MAERKPMDTIILDSGPIIKNTPGVSSLLAQAEHLITTPAVISEIRDAATRQRVDTLLKPFLSLRNPTSTSVKVIQDFARRTGDLEVLSRTDIQILALAYELECEKNGDDWRLRKVPGQKELNGPIPGKVSKPAPEDKKPEVPVESSVAKKVPSLESLSLEKYRGPLLPQFRPDSLADIAVQQSEPEAQLSNPWLSSSHKTTADVLRQPAPKATSAPTQDYTSAQPSNAPTSSLISSQPLSDLPTDASQEDTPSSDSDSEGWITPSNLKKHQKKDGLASLRATSEPVNIAVATITTDFAMQNVLLQMNLNLLSPQLQCIRQLKSFVLRCYACFMVTRDMSKQFCSRCGKPSLTKVSCSTDQAGNFKIHLKKNFQLNKRGDRYSIPKPVSGSANGRANGGGKGGWGQDLILTEDQKEYTRAVGEQKRLRQKDLMDEDYLPSILTGDRGRTGGRPKVGAGRNINSKKRH